MSFSTVGMSASEIASKVRTGEVSALEVAQEHIDLIKQHDSLLNAYLHITEDLALRQAKRVDEKIKNGEDPGLLAGVPIGLKDNLATRGIATTCASQILKDWKPPYDATVLEKIYKSGAVAIGKTNLDEFAMGSSTENSSYVTTKNPYDLSRVPGGSSGGSAASVAARFTPLALGSDTGGSIRQPAALCGIVGVKPTYGMVSRYGLLAFASSLDQIGPFAHNVADAALLLKVISGHDDKDSTSLSVDLSDFTSQVGAPIDGLRVGIVTELIEGAAPEVRKAVLAAAGVLAASGAKVDHVSVPAVTYGLSAYYLIAPAEASSNLARYDGVRYGLRIEGQDMNETYVLSRTKGFGPEVKRRIMLGTFALSSGYYDAYYGRAQKVRTMIINSFAQAYENFDVLLSPTAPTTAFEIGAKAQDPLSMYLSDVCTIPTNLAGHPAMSVPYGLGENEMPIGVQVMAPALGEANMFRIAAAIESKAPAITRKVFWQ